MPPCANQAEVAPRWRSVAVQPVHCQLCVGCDPLKGDGVTRPLEGNGPLGAEVPPQLATGPQRLHGLLGDRHHGIAIGALACHHEGFAEAAAGREGQLRPVPLGVGMAPSSDAVLRGVALCSYHAGG